MTYRMADLFSGTGSASDPAIARGWEVERVDILDGHDVRDWVPTGRYDLVWASPPCECFSVASMGRHWGGGRRAYVPKTQAALDAIQLARLTFRKVSQADARFKLVENPRGMLRKIVGAPTATTWWCKWGDGRAKPSDLWGNFPPGILPLPMCRNGARDHEAARRGSKTGGTQARHGLDRARIPREFMEALLDAIEAADRPGGAPVPVAHPSRAQVALETWGESK